MGFHFMNNESYEQTMMEEKFINKPELIKEGSNVDILFDSAKDIPLIMELPQYLTLQVTYTEPGIKGVGIITNTSTGSPSPHKVCGTNP